MTSPLRLSLLAIAFLTAWGSAYARDYPYSGGPITIPIHPNFRTEIVFPEAILRVTGTQQRGGLAFEKRENVLSVRPIEAAQHDSRLRLPIIAHVYLPGRTYQLSFVYDFTASDHLHTIADAGYPKSDAESTERDLSPIEVIFLHFIRNDGDSTFLRQQQIHVQRTLSNGWKVTLTRSFVYGRTEFLAGELSMDKPAALTADDFKLLNLFPNRLGAVHIPTAALSRSPVPDDKQDTAAQPAKSLVPVYFLFRREE